MRQSDTALAAINLKQKRRDQDRRDAPVVGMGYHVPDFLSRGMGDKQQVE